MSESSPDDLRMAGWKVIGHFDFGPPKKTMTRWTFEKDSRAVTGVGRSDAEALELIRSLINLPSLLPPITNPPKEGGDVNERAARAVGRDLT